MTRPARQERVVLAVTACVPLLLVPLLAFRTGGYRLDGPGLGIAVLAALLAWRAIAAPALLVRPGRAATAAAAALLGLAAWQGLSALWSDAPPRALLDALRSLFYLVALLVYATLPTPALAAQLRAVCGGVSAVVLVALASRLLPEVVPSHFEGPSQRLGWPVGYWNGLGLMAAVSLVLTFHLSADSSESQVVRRLAAAAFPLVAVTLYFTGSRGAAAAALVGLAAYALLGRPGQIVAVTLALTGATALALAMVYPATALIGPTPAEGEAVTQGLLLFPLLLGCAALAGFAHARLTAVGALDLHRLVGGNRKRIVVTGGVLLLVAVAGAGIQSGWVERQYQRFTSSQPEIFSDPRDRLVSPSNNGRLDLWRVALRSSESRRLTGTGAGTFQLAWDLLRSTNGAGVEGHSLYVETLSELGVVGAALLLALLSALAAGTISSPAPRLGRAAAGAAGAAWLLHAAVDWDWEITAVGAPLFLLAGAACARPRSPSAATSRRWVLAAGCATLSLAGLTAAFSQWELEAAWRGYETSDCKSAVAHAHRADQILTVRPEPKVVRALCAARDEAGARSVREMEKAAALDPHNWEYAYGVALAQGLAGEDPTDAFWRAYGRNRFAPELRRWGMVVQSNPDQWPRILRQLPTSAGHVSYAPIEAGPLVPVASIPHLPSGSSY